MYLVSIPAPPSAAHLVDQRQRAAASRMILFGDVGILTWCQSIVGASQFELDLQC